MPRLRLEVELNRGRAGVPLQKLSSVARETEKFLQLLSADLQIEQGDAGWLVPGLEAEPPRFTIEYQANIASKRIADFNAAFDGGTQLRKATIWQFTKIADSLEAHELVGLGLYTSDEQTEPVEWRALTRRAAVQIQDEIRSLSDSLVGGELGSRLPGIEGRSQTSARQTKPNTVLSAFEQMEARLMGRVSQIEIDVNGNSEVIRGIQGRSIRAEESLRKLLAAVNAFCDRASKRLAEGNATTAPGQTAFVPPLQAARIKPPLSLYVLVAISLLGVASLWIYVLWRSPRPVLSAPNNPLVATPGPEVAAGRPRRFTVEFTAKEQVWMEVRPDGHRKYSKLMEAGQTTSLHDQKRVRVRVGNAGGLEIKVDGKLAEPIGNHGQVREIEITAAGVKCPC